MALTILLAAAVALAGGPPAPAMDAVVDRAVAQGFAGVVLVSDAHATTYARAIGMADVEAGRPHRLEERWPFASVTKQVTALLVMQQVAQGRMALEAPISAYVPDFKSPSAGALTVRQLLQHTSGLPNPADSPDGGTGVPAFYLKTGRKIGDAAAAGGFCAGPTKHPPGGPRFEYNNCDFLVLGAALEHVAGRPYAALVKADVARPLKLRSLAMAADRVGPYGGDVTGYEAPGKRAPALNYATFGAAGALGGTGEDLAAIDRGLLTFKLLPEAESRTMWAGNAKLGYVALGAWGFSAPLKGCAGPVELVERRGEAGGVEVRNVLAPKLGRALVVLTNNEATPFGEVWQGAGLSYDLLSAAFCGA